MSVLIKGMEMPRACQVCPLSYWNKLDQLTGCELTRRYVPKDDEDFWNNDRPSWCPLIPVPNHGRLIDLDDLMPRIQEEIYQSKLVFRRADCEWENGVWFGENKIGDMVLNSPVVIPAEKDGET